MAWFQWALIFLVTALAAFAGLYAIGERRWAAGTRVMHERLEAARSGVLPVRYAAATELDGLPAPVQRFFRAALKDGQPLVDAMAIAHAGTFNLAAQGPDQWKPFTSTQRSTMRRPGFVWDGRVVLLPGMAVRVHDAYIAGEGFLHPAVMGLFSLARLRSATPEPGGLAQGELMRWLAEAAWYPTALLPSQGVRWSPMDDHAALATLDDGAVSVTLQFRFDPGSGLIAGVRAEARGRTVGREVVLAPWVGRWSEYVERDGMRVPLKGEVAYEGPEGERAYWRGTVTRLHYDYAG